MHSYVHLFTNMRVQCTYINIDHAQLLIINYSLFIIETAYKLQQDLGRN